MEFHHRNDRSIKSLINLASHGFYPLFEPHWLWEMQVDRTKKLTGNEKAKAKTLFKKISAHRNIERQKTVLTAMAETDRRLFVRAFFKMVENKIMDGQYELQ